MSIFGAYLSGTQTLGKINTYITLFILSIFILITLFFLYNTIFNYKPKPHCDTVPPGVECSSMTRGGTIILISIILAILVGIFYFNFVLKDNKAFQTVRGVRSQANFVNNLFRKPRPRFRGPRFRRPALRGPRFRR